MPGLLFTPEEASKYIGISEDRLRKMRYAGNGPRITYLPLDVHKKRPRYLRSDLDQWVGELEQYTNVSEAKDAMGV